MVKELVRSRKKVLVGDAEKPPPPEDFGGRRENARTTKTKRTELEINKTNKGF